MAENQLVINFSGDIWLYEGDAPWHFISLPKGQYKKIKNAVKVSTRGFGSIKTEVELGKSRWSTSLFPDSKEGTYVLPLKASVRKSESVQAGDRVKLSLIIKKDQLKKKTT